MKFDLAIIGNDEAALEMSCVAAIAGQSTVAIMPESRHSAWMLAQALRRVVTDLLVDQTPIRRQRMHASGTPRMLRNLLTTAIVTETTDQIRLLDNVGVHVILGESRILSATELMVSTGIDYGRRSIRASNIVIGTGVRHTAVHRPLGLMPFHRPESLFEGTRLAETLTIVGGDQLGAGLAALFSIFGVETRWLSQQTADVAMAELAVDAGVRIEQPDLHDEYLQDELFSRSACDVVDCRRTLGFTENLNLNVLGVEPDENGQLWCSSSMETWCTGVFGIGSVVGFTSNAPSSARRQADRILNRMTHRIPRPHFLRTRNRIFDYV